MAKGKTQIVYAQGQAEYARLKFDNRDTGANLEPGDQKNKIESVQGYYLMNLLITEDEQDRMIEAGIPDSGMAGQLFKKNKDTKQRFYKCKRQHYNQAFVKHDEEGNVVSDGVLGEPQVFLLTEGSAEITEDGRFKLSDDGKLEPFDGLIGNGSEVIVKFSVWDGKKVEMLGVVITDLVEYEAEGGNEVGF